MKWKSYLAGVFSAFLLLMVAATAYFLGKRQIKISNTPTPSPTPTVNDQSDVGKPTPFASNNINKKKITAGGGVFFSSF